MFSSDRSESQAQAAFDRALEARQTRRGLMTGGAKVAGAVALAGTAPSALGGLTASRSAQAQEATPAGAVVTGTPNEQMAEVLAAFAGFDNPPLPTVDPQVARELPSFADAYRTVLSNRGEAALEAVADITTILIPGPAGDLAGRVFTPEGDGPFPVIVYFHGGGFVIANITTYENSCRALANAAGAVVVSVGYRQAPENPFPAAVDDAYAATQYLIANAELVNGDPARVAVAGESAGGNLAAVVCLLARDQGGALPVHQLLVYPITTFAPEGDAAASLGDGSLFLNQDALLWFAGYYQPDPTSTAASPLLADLSDLPPATIILAEIDPLRAQGEVYGQALEDAGVDVTVTTYEGVTHEFFGMTRVVDAAADAVAESADRLRASFGEAGGETDDDENEATPAA